MTVIRMQPPRDGCNVCGKPVRTRKEGEWICAKCKAGYTPNGWTVRRGNYYGSTDDRADRWYADQDGHPIDHRGRGHATRKEAIVSLLDRLHGNNHDAAEDR